MDEEMKTNAIDYFLEKYSKQVFDEWRDKEEWLRIEIADLVEKIYREELKIADDKWQECQEELSKY